MARQTALDEPGAAPVAARRQSLIRSLVVLALAAAALFCFIAILADVRRASNALRHASAQAEHYAMRAQGSAVLPLNLEPKTSPGLAGQASGFASISTAEAMRLRRSGKAVMAAWTEPVFRLFGRDGRAVVFFHLGHFEAKWMSAGEFESARAAQAAELERLAAPDAETSRGSE